MDILSGLPIPLFAFLVFLLRMIDVSMGTLRVLSIVSGKWRTAMMLGFIEVMIWIAVVSQVVKHVGDNPILAVAFAGGFAAGNATGVWVEKRLGHGRKVLRMIVPGSGEAVAAKLRDLGQAVTTFPGSGRDGPVTLIYLVAPGKRMREMIEHARRIEPDVFYVIDRADSWRNDLPLANISGSWRAWWKRK